MAESEDTTPEETPDEAVDAVEAAEAGTTGEAEAAEAAEAAEPAAPAAPAEPAAPAPSKAEQRAAAQHKERSSRPARTPEQRRADRAEQRRAKAVARRRRRLQEREKTKASRGETPPPTPPVDRPKGGPKVRQGVVVSDKADKTITVRIDVARRHRRYEKIVRSSVTLHAHDEENSAGAGDVVRLVETRPLSRTKRWRLDEVLEKAR